MCDIHQNFDNGILTVAKKGFWCDGLIQLTKVYKNKENGILIAGKFNFTKIDRNFMIANNWWAGIKIIEEAHASILRNFIFANFG